MSSFVDMKYPLVNTKLPGLNDVRLVASVIINKPIKIVEHGISEVTKTAEGVSVNVYIKYKTPEDTETVIAFTVNTNTYETIPVSTADLTGTVSAYISFEELLYTEQSTTLTGNSGALEPCTLLVIPKTKTNIYFVVSTTSETVLDSVPKFTGGFSLTKMQDGTYNLYGETPYEILEIDRGIVSVNGLKGPDLQIHVSDSFTIVNDHDNHVIEITEK